MIELGRGTAWCNICGEHRAVIGWCDPCRRSYDKARNKDSSILTGLLWAADRARRFERRRARKSGNK